MKYMNLECSGKLVIGITKCYTQKCNGFFRKEKKQKYTTNRAMDCDDKS